MATFTKEELQYLATELRTYVMEQIRSSSMEVDGVETVYDTEGITTLPVYDNRGGQRKIVRIDISAFSRPATDATESALQAAARAENAADLAEGVVDEAVLATENANAAAESANELVTEGEEIISRATSVTNDAESAENIRKQNETARQGNESVREDNETARIASENERDSAETLRKQWYNQSKPQLDEAIERAVSVSDALVANPPKIQNEVWHIYDIEEGQYVATTSHALGKSPYISDHDTWMVYNDSAGEWEDTGKSVDSTYDLTKEKVEAVLTGDILTHHHTTQIYELLGDFLSRAIQNYGNYQTSDAPHPKNAMVKFAGKRMIALEETSDAPIGVFLDENGNRLLDFDGTYIVAGEESESWEPLIIE